MEVTWKYRGNNTEVGIIMEETWIVQKYHENGMVLKWK